MTIGLVVEGVVAAGKTTLLSHLQRHLVDLRPACTKLVLSEHYTERVLEDKRAACTLAPDDVLTHAAGVLQLVESLHALRAGSKFAGSTAANADIVVLVERWMGSHAANLAELGIPLPPVTIGRFNDHCCRLHDLGIRFVVLVVPDDDLRGHIEHTLARRNAAWRRYIESLGGLDRAVQRYADWQGMLTRFYDSLPVPYRTVQVSNGRSALDVLAISLAEELFVAPVPR